MTDNNATRVSWVPFLISAVAVNAFFVLYSYIYKDQMSGFELAGILQAAFIQWVANLPILVIAVLIAKKAMKILCILLFVIHIVVGGLLHSVDGAFSNVYVVEDLFAGEVELPEAVVRE